jgi:Tfp pilus assembly protein PilW
MRLKSCKNFFFNKSLKSEAGFSLVELILYIGVSATILTVVSVFLFALWQVRVKNHAISEVEQQGMFVMRQITQSVKNAAFITAPAPGSEDQTLILQTYSSSTDPSAFTIDGSTINISEAGSPAMALTAPNVAVSNLVFTNLSRNGTPGVVRISFTLSYNSSSAQNEYQYQANFYDSASIRK